MELKGVGTKARYFAMGVAIFEILMSIGAIVLFSFATITFPKYGFLVALPDAILTEKFRMALIHASLILAIFELIMGILLLDSTRRVIRHRVRFWLNIMLAYVILSSIFFVGVETTGESHAKLNAVIIANLVMRFVQFGFVFVFLEEEKKWRKKSKHIKMIPQTVSILPTSSLPIQVDIHKQEIISSTSVV